MSHVHATLEQKKQFAADIQLRPERLIAGNGSNALDLSCTRAMLEWLETPAGERTFVAALPSDDLKEDAADVVGLLRHVVDYGDVLHFSASRVSSRWLDGLFQASRQLFMVSVASRSHPTHCAARSKPLQTMTPFRMGDIESLSDALHIATTQWLDSLVSLSNTIIDLTISPFPSRVPPSENSITASSGMQMDSADNRVVKRLRFD